MSLSDALGIWGLVVSVIGFGLTVWQLVRTANAAIATKAAIIQVNRRMLMNHLLVLLPQIRTLEADLDAAIAADDHLAAIRALNSFSHTASQIASLLDADKDPNDAALISDLRSSASTASANKSLLVSGVKRPLTTVLRTVSAQIGDISSRCAGLTTKYQVKVS